MWGVAEEGAGGVTAHARCGLCAWHFQGYCRRFPPEIITNPRNGSTVTMWPETSAEDFCGEFTARPAPVPTVRHCVSCRRPEDSLPGQLCTVGVFGASCSFPGEPVPA